jgi:MerR family transcriptional regulator, copper efflux regulator
VLIGQLAKQSGLSRDTIRYYEKLGLIATPARAAGSSYKVYGPDSQRRLGDIAQLKKAGFTLREIRQLASDAAPCRGLPQRVQAKIESLDRKLEELAAYRESLIRVERACNEDCSTAGGLPDCVLPAARGCCA